MDGWHPDADRFLTLIQVRYRNGAMWRYGGINQGLPFGNLTACLIAAAGEFNKDNNLDSVEIYDAGQVYWVGSADGVALFNSKDSKYPWRVFQGYRWITGERVINLYQVQLYDSYDSSTNDSSNNDTSINIGSCRWNICRDRRRTNLYLFEIGQTRRKSGGN